MKKKFVASFFIVAAFMLVVSQVGFAQDLKGRLGLGARVSYVNFTDDTIDGVDVEPGESALYEANLTYFIQKYLSLELSVGYTEADVDISGGDGGDLTSIPVLLSLRGHLSTNTKVSPYVTVGIGYLFNDIDQNDSTIESIYGSGAKVDVDNSFEAHVGAGVEVFISEKAAVNLDFKYIWTAVDVGVNIPGLSDEEININPYVLGLGFKYYF